MSSSGDYEEARKQAMLSRLRTTPSTGAVLLVWGIGLLFCVGFWVLVVAALIKYVF